MSFRIATTVDEALAAIAAGAQPIAGGSDLVVGARHGKFALPDDLVAIDRIGELRHITPTADGVRVGAITSHHEIETSELLAIGYSALADASALVGSPATRHVGTLGGNIMNASPAMDTGAPLTVLQADVELRSSGGTRRLPIGQLWTGPGRTSAAPGELCIAVNLPTPAPRTGSAYLRLEYRRAMEIAVVGAAAAVTLAADGTVSEVRLALTAVAPTILAVDVTALAGSSVDDAAKGAATAAAAASSPISDVRASADYRRHTVGVMAGRAIAAAARRARGEHIAIPLNRALGIGAAS